MSHEETLAHKVDRYVGLRIKLARRQCEPRMSQEILAAKLGITFQQLQKYENAKNRITAGKLALVSKATNKPVEWFFPKFVLRKFAEALVVDKALTKEKKNWKELLDGDVWTPEQMAEMREIQKKREEWEKLNCTFTDGLTPYPPIQGNFARNILFYAKMKEAFKQKFGENYYELEPDILRKEAQCYYEKCVREAEAKEQLEEK